jgi:hypothetical protein
MAAGATAAEAGVVTMNSGSERREENVALAGGFPTISLF